MNLITCADSCFNVTSITLVNVHQHQYSGGQASEGQGGFYGSGGARVSTSETEHKPEMVS